MQYTTLITHISDTSWRAVVPALPDCTVEAGSREEALSRIKERIREVVQRTEVLQLDVPAGPTPVKKDQAEQSSQTPWEWAGLFKDDASWIRLFDDIEADRNANWLEPDSGN